MASEAQQKFFRNLTESRQFPTGSNIDGLREQFANLDEGSASKWIEAALELPERGAVAPPWVTQTPAAPTDGSQPPSPSGTGGTHTA